MTTGKQVVLYFAKFHDGGTYGTGPHTDGEGATIPAGVLGYEDMRMALEVARVIDGCVIGRPLELAIERCQNTGAVLYIRHSDGRTSYIVETVPEEANLDAAIRIEGPEREALIHLGDRQRQGWRQAWEKFRAMQQNYKPEPDPPDMDTWPCCPICGEYLDDDGECLMVKDGEAKHDPLIGG